MSKCAKRVRLQLAQVAEFFGTEVIVSPYSRLDLESWNHLIQEPRVNVALDRSPNESSKGTRSLHSLHWALSVPPKPSPRSLPRRAPTKTSFQLTNNPKQFGRTDRICRLPTLTNVSLREASWTCGFPSRDTHPARESSEPNQNDSCNKIQD